MAATTAAKREQKNGQLINPFYSPSFIDDGNEQYKYAQYKVHAILGLAGKLLYLSLLAPPFSLPFRTFLGNR